MSEERNNRVREYLRVLYGKDPEPLRSYLHQHEAMKLTADHAPGRAIIVDLDIVRYPGKYRIAVEDGIRCGLDPSGWDFWHTVRTTYLELSGAYGEDMSPPVGDPNGT